MTATQICAFIGLIVTAGLLLWFGYMMGRSDGLAAGLEDGRNTQSAESAKTIRELEASLQFIRADHLRQAKICKRFEASPVFGPTERQALLAIGELLRIAAETFSAFRTGKKLERDARSLREQTLAMIVRLQPTIDDGQAEQPLDTADQINAEAV